MLCIYKPFLAIIVLVVIPIFSEPGQPFWLDPWLLTLEPTTGQVLDPPLVVAVAVVVVVIIFVADKAML